MSAGESMSWVFGSRYPADEIGWWADRYSYVDDAEVEGIGRMAGSRGWYTHSPRPPGPSKADH